MRIGELARTTATPVETIRYYEREGLLPAPQRTESNYRVYGPAQVDRLRFIRLCRGLDLSLEEVRVLLALRDAPEAGCEAVDELIDAHIGHVAERIRELRRLQRALMDLRSRCAGGGGTADCAILDGLARGLAPTPPSTASAHPGGTHRASPARRRA